MEQEQMSILKMVNRCLAIEEEYDSISNIQLSIGDVEDISDNYQEKLEQKWHKEELEAEYAELNKKLGYNLRVLSDIKSRRTGM